MLIIVEGPDCAGKTTLVERLAEQLVKREGELLELRHCGPLRKPALEEYELRLDDYVPGTDRNIIYDRFHLGEAIYGPLKRGESQMTREMWLHIELNLASKGALLVLVDTDNETLLERAASRGEDFVSPAELLEVADVYRRHQHRVSPVTQFNCMRSSAQSLPSLLLSMAQVLEDNAWRLGGYRTVVGPPLSELHQPQVLLVGDERGPNEGFRRHDRAFVPYPSTSGAFLLRTIDPFAWAGTTCIANANDQDDIGAVWDSLGNPHVVGLGRKASHTLKVFNIPHGVAPHPQYVRRFHASEGEAYHDMIVRAALKKEDLGSWPS